jgi:hypothetical protein
MQINAATSDGYEGSNACSVASDFAEAGGLVGEAMGIFRASGGEWTRGR